MNDIDSLQKWIINRPESSYLECKDLRDNPKLSDKGRNAEIFGIALSGFANNEGGVLVWGIKEIKKGGEFDHREMKPFKGVRKFEEELNLLAGEWVAPVVEGFRTKPIYTNESKDEGVILVLIPKSDFTPHMSKVGKIFVELKNGKSKKIELGYRYYRRSGSSFKPMEHSEIDDMFGRRPKPKFKLGFKFLENIEDKFNLEITLENIGKATAKDFSFRIVLPDNIFQVHRLSGCNCYPIPESVLYGYSYMANQKLFPGMKLRVFTCLFYCTQPWSVVDFFIYCDNIAPIQLKKIILIKRDNSIELRTSFDTTFTDNRPVSIDPEDVRYYFSPYWIEENKHLWEIK